MSRKILVTCLDGVKRPVTLRASLSHIRSEKALKAAIERVLESYRKQGGAWAAYADALESKGIIEQLCLIGMISK